MKPELIVIDTEDVLENLILHLGQFEYVAFDTETTGLNASDQIIGYSVCGEESVAYYVILAFWQNDQLVWNPLSTRTTDLLALLKTKKLIGHNISFDCMMVESNFKISLIDSVHTDTMILAQLLDENRKVGLKELGASMYGEDSKQEQEEMKASVLANGGKLTKDCYEMYKADSHLMAKYGAKDAWLTYKLFLDLVPELYDQGLDKFFYEDESMPLLRGPTYELNNTGMAVDTKKLQALNRQLVAEIEADRAFIYQEIDTKIKTKYPGTNKKTTFNICSNVQLSWLLFGEMGLEFNTLTKEGKNVCRALGMNIPYSIGARTDFIKACRESVGTVYYGKKKIKEPWSYIAVDKKCIATFSAKYKWVERLTQFQKKRKLLNTYVEGIEKRMRYGVIRPNFLQHGTTSGRYACRNPNFQNLPRDDKRIKECIIPRPGKVFVGADYSQLEPRVFAYTSGDKNLMAAFKSADDFYSVIGMRVYDKTDCTPRKDGADGFGVKYKKLRDLSKVIALASTYGATARQLAGTTGKSTEDTQNDIDAYFEAFPGVKKMMLDSHEMAKNTGQVTNLFGRPRRMPEAKEIKKLFGSTPHAELDYVWRNMLNLSVNHRIQSTGASIVNRAAIKFYQLCKEAEISAKLVLQVHDSLVVECEEADADNVLTLLQYSMEETVILPEVALEAVPKIGNSLAVV